MGKSSTNNHQKKECKIKKKKIQKLNMIYWVYY